jgi:hypothetical protein
MWYMRWFLRLSIAWLDLRTRTSLRRSIRGESHSILIDDIADRSTHRRNGKELFATKKPRSALP